MKTTIYILLFFTIGVIWSCDNVLDATRLDVISGDAVWDDEALVDAYMAKVYDESELLEDNDNAYDPYSQRYGTQALGAEAYGRPQNGAYNYTTGQMSEIGQSPALPDWDWKKIRRINVAIDELSDENSTLPNDFREQRLGEAYFLRAHAYFRKVIRYGGVPLINEAQDPSLSPEELRVPRSTEKATYDFIAEDLNEAAKLLAGKNVPKGRINEPAVWMLKSRAMLYAASIAKNNELLPFKDADGLVGINPNEANGYYQQSLDASKKILPPPYGTGSFALRSGNTVSDYRKIFNDIDSDNDSESILTIQFTGEGGRYNNEGVYLIPRAMPEHVNWGAWQSAWLETVEWYDYRDGTDGRLLPDGSGSLRNTLFSGQFYNLVTLFENRDPRFRASLALPPFEVKGFPAYMHKSVTDANAAKELGVPTAGPKQNRQSSAVSVYKTANDLNPMPVNNIGIEPLAVFRIAEAYLNYAEAAYELGEENGLEALNDIRKRVGMPERGELTMEYIIYERKIELAFESHRFWDLRRWRIAEAELSPSEKYKLIEWKWDVVNNTYTGTLKDEKHVRLFKPEHYYFPIPLSQIQDNDQLVQNPGYDEIEGD